MIDKLNEGTVIEIEILAGKFRNEYNFLETN